MTISYTLAKELSAYSASTMETSLGLVTLSSSGLTITTSPSYKSNLADLSSADRSALQYLGAPGSANEATTLTTALYSKVHLVAGQTLTLTYNYHTLETAGRSGGAAGKSDFAFAYLEGVSINYLAYTNYVNGIHGTDSTIYASQFNITRTGDYDLVIGAADDGDTAVNPTLTVKSITVTTPGTDIKVAPTSLTFKDGSQATATGSLLLPTGVANEGVFSAGTIALINAAPLISQDGGGLISQDGGGLISQDGGGLISQDGGSLISQDGGGLISQDGGGLISQDGGGLISQDGGGLVASGAGNLLATRALVSVDLSPPAVPPVRIGGEIRVGEAAPSYTHQNNPVIAALTTGQFVVAWSDDNTSSGHFEVRAQLLNPDGSKAAPSFLVSTATTSDQITPSVAALADGHFAVSWRGPASGAADLHTQLFDRFGAKVGDDIHVGASGVTETAPHTAALAGGGFVTVFETTIPGVFDSNAGGGRLYGADGTAGAIFGFGSTSDPTTKGGVTVTALQDGGFAIAYRETNAAASDQDGIYLDIYAAGGAQTQQGIHVNTTVPGVQNAPAIATLQNGDIVVSWVDAGAKNTTNDIAPIFGQIFHADGTKVRGEVQIGNTLSGSDAPTITPLSDGRFAITWDATSQTGDAVTGLNLTTQFFTADGARSGTALADNPVSQTDAYREQSPSATQLANGTFAVVGSKSDGGTSTITANLFNLDGTGAPAASAADLKVTTAFLDKTVAGPGDTINLSYQIKNAGTLPAGTSTSKIYISDDATITSADRLVGTIVEPGLLAGTSVSDTLDILIPSDLSRGVHHIGVIVDANGQVGESNEANNVSRPVAFGPPASKSGIQFQVDSGTADTHDASQSHVTALSNGGYVVTWTDSDQSSQFTASSHDVGQVFTAAGIKVGGTFDVEALTGGLSAQDLSVSALAGGKFVATWSQNDYANAYATYQSQQIHAQIFNADGTRSGSDIVVDPGISGSPTNKYQYQGGAPAVTTLSDGRFLVTYAYEKDYDHTPTFLDDGRTVRIIEGHIYNADGTSAGSTFQASTSAYLGNPTSAYHPVVAALANGGFVVTYNGSDYTSGTVPAYNGVLAQIYDASAHAVGSEFIVNSQRDYDQDFQDVVGLTNGDFVVTWRDLRASYGQTVGAGEDQSHNGVYGQVMTATGQRVGGQFLVNTTTLSDQGLAKITALPDGRFVVTWTDASGTSGDFHDDIRAQVFNPDGAKSGTEFLVNTTTGGEQAFSSIAALTNDDFVVAWNDGYTTFPSHRAVEAQAFTFGTPAPLKPDLTLTSASLDAHAATAGQTVHLTYTVANSGPGDAGASTSKVYLSSSTTVTSADRLVATHADAAIAAGQSHSDTVDIVLPSDLSYGTYHLAVIADAAGQVAETVETNNASTSSLSVLVSTPITPPPVVSGTPDLAFFHGANDVTAARASVAAGDTNSISYYVVNNGTANAAGQHTGIYLSSDANVTTGDTLLTSHDTPALYAYLNGYGSGPNYDYESASFTVPTTVAPGTYYVGAIADYDGLIGETNESNNISNAVQITVTPRLAVQAPVVFITGAIAGDDVIDRSDAASLIAVGGTVTHLDDGSFVRVSIKDPAGHVVGTLPAAVSAGTWGLSLPPGLLAHAEDGIYTVEATASNVGGTSVADHVVTVALAVSPVVPTNPVADTTKPVVSVTAPAAAIQAISAAGAAVAFSGVAADAVDGTDPVVFREGASVVTAGQMFGLGPHTVTAGATDAAGNAADPVSFSFTVVDTTKPVVSLTAPATRIEAASAAGAAASFSGTATDAVDGTDPVVFREGASVVTSGQVFGVGAHTVTAAATDAAGNVADPVSFSFEVVASAVQAPVVSITGSIAGDDVIDRSDAASLISVGGTATHLDDGSFVQVSIKDPAGHVIGTLPAAVSAGTWSLSLPAGLLARVADGVYIVEATASNAGGASVADHLVTVALVVPPVGPTNPVSDPAVSGRVIDGYLAGATVWGDANGNGTLDPGEASTRTDAAGAFTLVGASGSLVALGGTDISTGQPFRGVLTAPAGAGVITPLTTLVDALGHAGVADPVGKVLAGFGIAAGFDLLGTDPVAAAASGDGAGRAALVAGAAVIDTVVLLAAGLSGASGGSLASSTAAVGLALASHLTGSPVDLTSEAFLAGLGGEAGLSAAAAAATAKSAAVLNISVLHASGAADLSTTLAATQALAQGSVATALFAAHGDPAGLSEVAAGIAPILLPPSTPTHADPLSFGTYMQDASSPGGKVFEFYEGFLGRAPDALGLETWVNAIGHGTSLAAVAQSFLASSEYVAAHGPISGETDAGFVSELDHVVLGRSGDAAGTAFWTDALAHGATRGEVAADFALSSEHVAHDSTKFGSGVFVADADKADVARLYYAVLDRAPDAGGLSFWSDAVKAGTGEAAVAQVLLTSPEYTAVHGAAASPETFVTGLYEGALGRAPDAAGLAFWTGALAHGQSRAAVVLAIGESLEAKGHHLGDIEAGWHLA